MKGHSPHIPHNILAVITAMMLCGFSFPASAGERDEAWKNVCDVEAACALCDSLPLRGPEGVWIYPDDNVTVLVTEIETDGTSTLPLYRLTVVETYDCNLNPGDEIGTLQASPDQYKYTLTLFTNRKNGILSNPQPCLATLSKEGDTMILEREKSKIKLRVNFNPSTLLPTLWKSLMRFGISIGDGTKKKEAPTGMVKIYPSYDGNGSARRGPRYL